MSLFPFKSSIPLPYNSLITLLDTYPRDIKNMLHKDLHVNACNSFIPNSVMQEISQMSTKWCINKQIVVHICNEIHSIKRKEMLLHATTINLKIFILSKRRKDTKGYILYDSWKFLGKAKLLKNLLG